MNFGKEMWQYLVEEDAPKVISVDGGKKTCGFCQEFDRKEREKAVRGETDQEIHRLGGAGWLLRYRLEIEKQQ